MNAIVLTAIVLYDNDGRRRSKVEMSASDRGEGYLWRDQRDKREYQCRNVRSVMASMRLRRGQLS